MITVAVAGAGRFGMCLVRAIQATTKHEIVLLTRSGTIDSSQLRSQDRVTVRAINYDDHGKLVKALAGVHTVISTVFSFDGDAFLRTQMQLLRASQDAPSVKRFAPSEFALPTDDGIDAYEMKRRVWAAVQKSGLEYTRFACGLWMNFLGSGTPKGEDEAIGASGRAWKFGIDIIQGKAELPGDGMTKISMTDIYDVARFVAGSLDLEKWEPVSGMVGDNISMLEVVKEIERVTGRKIQVEAMPIEEMEELSHDPTLRFYYQARIAMARGKALIENPSLNNKLPHIKPTTVRDFLQKWWGGVDVSKLKSRELPEVSSMQSQQWREPQSV